jgi:hypothetical protein
VTLTHNAVYRARYPYDGYVEVGLAYSSKAVLVTFITSVCVAIVPIFLANIRLPGMTVVSGGNSAIISAACHYPSKRLQSPNLSGNEYDSSSARLIGDTDVEELEDIVKKKIKWGRLSTGKGSESQVGHLGFGTEDQGVDRPLDGEQYSGF